MEGGLGGGIDGGGERIRTGRKWRRLKLGEDNVANITLWMETNDTFAYDPELKYHHPIMSTLGKPGGRLERERIQGARLDLLDGPTHLPNNNTPYHVVRDTPTFYHKTVFVLLPLV